MGKTCFFQGLQDANFILGTSIDFDALIGIAHDETLVANAQHQEEEFIYFRLAL